MLKPNDTRFRTLSLRDLFNDPLFGTGIISAVLEYIIIELLISVKGWGAILCHLHTGSSFQSHKLA